MLMRDGVNMVNRTKTIVSTLFMALVMIAAASAVPVLATEPIGSCGPIDLTVVLDDTGSMGGAISNIKAELPTLVSTALTASGGDLHTALVTFNNGVSVIEPLTNDSSGALFSTAIGSEVASDGGDAAEPSDEAKNTVVNNLGPGLRADVEGYNGTQIGDFSPPWRASATKLAVLITDAPSNGFSENPIIHIPYGDANYAAHMAALGTLAGTKSIKFFDVFVPTNGDYAGQVANMTADAVNSGGAIITVNADGTGTGATINTILSKCGVGVTTGSISGTKYNDLNSSGTRDAGEPGLTNWTITLTNSTGRVVTKVTDVNGSYSFVNLTDGNYTVGEVNQSGWKQTAPATEVYSITISDGTVVTGIDFGNVQTVNKCDKKKSDDDKKRVDDDSKKLDDDKKKSDDDKKKLDDKTIADDKKRVDDDKKKD
jgi:hypothetical protein